MLVTDEAYCYLETVGRRSGKPRVVELWYGARGDTIYFLAGGREAAHWVRNIRAHPAVRVRVGGRTYPGRGRFIEGTDEEPLARRLLAAKYQGWSEGRPLSRWAREALPVAVDLDGDAG